MSVVGTVTLLQVQETRGEVVRVTWVGVQGATAYRVSWRRTDGGFIAVSHCFIDLTGEFILKHPFCMTCSVLSYSSFRPCAAVGGEERSQLVGGDVTAVDLDQLDPGAQYEVQVKALVQNREGTPVSVRVTTGEFCLPIFRGCKVPTSCNNL